MREVAYNNTIFMVVKVMVSSIVNLYNEFVNMLFHCNDKKEYFYYCQNHVYLNCNKITSYFHNGLIYHNERYLQLGMYKIDSDILNILLDNLRKIGISFTFGEKYFTIDYDTFDDSFKLDKLKNDMIGVYVLENRYEECKRIVDTILKNDY